MKKSALVVCLGASLLFAVSAHAKYLLVTASGSVSGGYDSTGYLGYGTGSTYRGQMQGLLGQTVIVSWLLNLDIAGADLLGGSQPGTAVYAGGTCPGTGNWMTTLGVTMGGSNLDTAYAPAGARSGCSTAEVSDEQLDGVFDHFLVSDYSEGTSTGTFDDGSTIKKTAIQGLVTRVDGYDYDFIDGIGLDQSFVWNNLVDTDAGFGNFFRNTTLENCFGADCLSSNLLNYGLDFEFTTLTAQVIRSVPEPSVLSLLCVGAIGFLFQQRRRRFGYITSLRNRS